MAIHGVVELALTAEVHARLLARVPTTSRLAKRLRAAVTRKHSRPREKYFQFTGDEDDALNLAEALDCVAPEELPNLVDAIRKARAALPETGSARF